MPSVADISDINKFKPESNDRTVEHFCFKSFMKSVGFSCIFLKTTDKIKDIQKCQNDKNEILKNVFNL